MTQNNGDKLIAKPESKVIDKKNYKNGVKIHPCLTPCISGLLFIKNSGRRSNK